MPSSVSLLCSQLLEVEMYIAFGLSVCLSSFGICLKTDKVYTVKILCIGTDRCHQTVQIKIRLLLKKQSDQDLRCLPFNQHLLDALMQCYSKLFYF